jgi:hypothetical protein
MAGLKRTLFALPADSFGTLPAWGDTPAAAHRHPRPSAIGI